MGKELRVRKGLVQVGDSKALIIPADWIKELSIRDGDVFYVELRGKKIVIEKAED